MDSAPTSAALRSMPGLCDDRSMLAECAAQPCWSNYAAAQHVIDTHEVAITNTSAGPEIARVALHNPECCDAFSQSPVVACLTDGLRSIKPAPAAKRPQIFAGNQARRVGARR